MNDVPKRIVRITKRLVIIGSIVGLLLSVLMIYQYILYTESTTDITREATLSQTKKAAKKLDKDFGESIDIVNIIAKDLSSGKLSKEDIITKTRSYISSDLKLFAIGISYIPHSDITNIRTKSPYYIKKNPDKEIPYNDKLLEIYSVPIYRFDSLTDTRIQIGNVFLDFLLSDVSYVSEQLDLGKSGYGFILSQNGTFIAHPVDEYNEQKQTIFDIAEERENKSLANLGEETSKGRSGILEYSDELTGQLSWFFYEPIKPLNWTLVIVFVKDDIPIDRNYLKNLSIIIGLIVLTFGVFAFAWLIRIYNYSTTRMIILSVWVSLLLFLKITYVLSLSITYSETRKKDFVRIIDRTGVENFLNSYTRRVSRLCGVTPNYIPTGVFFETIEFPSANNVFLSGTVWQKYTLGIHDSIERGIIFPEAISDNFTKSYHYKEGGFEVYGWYFRITVRKNFSYKKYPFDRKNLSIRILPKDFKNYIVLAPDLESYNYTNPNLLPGVSEKLDVGGWTMLSSNFAYQMNLYNSNFSLKDFNCREKTPELYFDISMSRNFLGTIFSGTMPIVVMLAILFILQTITTPDMSSVARILGPTGSFFFASLLAHVGLRNTLAIKDIVYFEFFYILLYMMILYVFFDSVLISRPKVIRLIAFRNNLILKLLYWPFFLTVLLFISITVLLM